MENDIPTGSFIDGIEWFDDDTSLVFGDDRLTFPQSQGKQLPLTSAVAPYSVDGFGDLQMHNGLKLVADSVMPLKEGSIELIETFLRTQPNVFPISQQHVSALSILTEESIISINAWFAQRIRVGMASSNTATEPHYAPSLTFPSTSETHSSQSIHAPIKGFINQISTQPGSYMPLLLPSAEEADAIYPLNMSNYDDSGKMAPETSLDMSLDMSARSFALDPADGIGTFERKRMLSDAAQAAQNLTHCLGNRCKRTRRMSDLERDPESLWQCTRSCGRKFRNKKNWVRHEGIGYPQQGWICPIGTTVLINEERRCSYCTSAHQVECPSETHALSMHRSAMSKCATGRHKDRRGVFTRFGHFVQHFQKTHPGLEPSVFAREAHFFVDKSAFPKTCGFCRRQLDSWRARLDHISDHFEFDGLDMRQWNNGYGHIPGKGQASERDYEDDDPEKEDDSGGNMDGNYQGDYEPQGGPSPARDDGPLGGSPQPGTDPGSKEDMEMISKAPTENFKRQRLRRWLSTLPRATSNPERRPLRLLNTKTLQLESHHSPPYPAYAILSHTWGLEEVSYRDLDDDTKRGKLGWSKIYAAALRARTDELQYMWVDTCCIDKSSTAELTEAIHNMFSWYQNASVCYTYLEDVTTCSEGDDLTRIEENIASSRWFTRGWTLQELIAPSRVEFYDHAWRRIGDKASLHKNLANITGIDEKLLLKPSLIESTAHHEKLSWIAKRQTTRQEDIAYCLVGIFNISMPLIYGEGSSAGTRLVREIYRFAPSQAERALKALQCHKPSFLMSDASILVRAIEEFLLQQGANVLPASSLSDSISSLPSYNSPDYMWICCKCGAWTRGDGHICDTSQHLKPSPSITQKFLVRVDASPDGKFLANCKYYRDGKKVGAYYNAAAHVKQDRLTGAGRSLRRAHFHPQKKREKQSTSDKVNNRDNADLNDPPMDELKKNWMREIEEERLPRVDSEDEELHSGVNPYDHPSMNFTNGLGALDDFTNSENFYEAYGLPASMDPYFKVSDGSNHDFTSSLVSADGHIHSGHVKV